jgi:TPR repeat protein
MKNWLRLIISMLLFFLGGCSLTKLLVDEKVANPSIGDDAITSLQPENVEELRKAAEPGDALAQYNLGVKYVNNQEDQEAVKWFSKAAEQGFAQAQFNLGTMYANGQGVTQNFQETVKWYHKAAEQGFAQAQFNLGTMYANGQGVTQDDQKAIKWFSKAAEQGIAEAYGVWGWILITQGKFDDAQSVTEKAHQMKPDNFAWPLNIGHTYLLKGDRQTARRYYQEALPLIPDEASLEQGPIADFELFIENGWQIDACRVEMGWFRQAFYMFHGNN